MNWHRERVATCAEQRSRNLMAVPTKSREIGRPFAAQALIHVMMDFQRATISRLVVAQSASVRSRFQFAEPCIAAAPSVAPNVLVVSQEHLRAGPQENTVLGAICNQ